MLPRTKEKNSNRGFGVTEQTEILTVNHHEGWILEGWRFRCCLHVDSWATVSGPLSHRLRRRYLLSVTGSAHITSFLSTETANLTRLQRTQITRFTHYCCIITTERIWTIMYYTDNWTCIFTVQTRESFFFLIIILFFFLYLLLSGWKRLSLLLVASAAAVRSCNHRQINRTWTLFPPDRGRTGRYWRRLDCNWDLGSHSCRFMLAEDRR